jgi:hypothetical protein
VSGGQGEGAYLTALLTLLLSAGEGGTALDSCLSPPSLGPSRLFAFWPSPRACLATAVTSPTSTTSSSTTTMNSRPPPPPPPPPPEHQRGACAYLRVRKGSLMTVQTSFWSKVSRFGSSPPSLGTITSRLSSLVRTVALDLPHVTSPPSIQYL